MLCKGFPRDGKKAEDEARITEAKEGEDRLLCFMSIDG